MRHLLLLSFAWVLIAAAPFDPFGEATIIERPGAAVPLGGALLDADGRPTSLAVLGAGRPMLLVPVLHDCPNFCGVTLDGVLDAWRAAGNPRVALIAFGIDPRERPQAARGDLDRLFARHPDASGKVAATTGDARTIGTVTQALGYRYAFDRRIGQYAHVAATAVLTPDGHLVRWLYGIAPKPETLRAALADAQAGRTGGVVDRLILLCYHYDPTQGRYGLAIDRILKAACIATVLALALVILALRRRERRAC